MCRLYALLPEDKTIAGEDNAGTQPLLEYGKKTTEVFAITFRVYKHGRNLCWYHEEALADNLDRA
jgi:hypothetical protein